MRGLLLLSLVLSVGCSDTGLTKSDAGFDATISDSSADAMPEASEMDATSDASDASNDAAEAGPSCECTIAGACCDGCHYKPTTTVCASSFVWTCTTLGSTEFTTQHTTETHCGATGACNGSTSVFDDQIQPCPSPKYCMVRASDMQAVCAN